MTRQHTSHLEKFKWPYLRKGRGRPIYSMFGSRVGFSGRRIECRNFQLDQIQSVCRKKQCARSNYTVTRAG